MNRDQVKGAAKDTAGKIQRKVGELTGNEHQQAKGAAKQVEGKIQKGVGNVEQALDRADKESRSQRARNGCVVNVSHTPEIWGRRTGRPSDETVIDGRPDAVGRPSAVRRQRTCPRRYMCYHTPR